MNNVMKFGDRAAFRAWLKDNWAQTEGIWIELSKVDDPSNTLKPMEALEEALCYGWVDSQIKPLDEQKYVKHFTKRAATSRWSDLNKRIVEKLMEEKKMEQPGLEAIEVARKNGNWEKGYDKLNTSENVEKFKEIIRDDREFLDEYSRLAPSHQRQYAAFYFDAKQEETRKNRIEKIKQAIKEKSKKMLY